MASSTLKVSPLRQRMLDAMQLRGKAVRTQGAYVEAVAHLGSYFKCSPSRLSSQQVQDYLLYLLRERKRSRSTVNQYGCAYRFFYGTVLGWDGDAFQIPLAPAPQRLPEILWREELARLFASACHDKARTFLHPHPRPRHSPPRPLLLRRRRPPEPRAGAQSRVHHAGRGAAPLRARVPALAHAEHSPGARLACHRQLPNCGTGRGVDAVRQLRGSAVALA